MKYKIIFCCPITSLSQIAFNDDNFVYLGNNTLPNHKNLINLNIDDKYENLALKMLLGFKELKNKDFDFLFKFDTDTYVNFKNIEKLNLSINNNYGFVHEGSNFKKQIEGKHPFKITTSFPLGGGYILSKQAVNILSQDSYINFLKTCIENNICTFEDVMVGKGIKENNLPLNNIGYWINKAKWAYSSCGDVFFHSLNDITKDSFLKISRYLRKKTIN